MNSLFCFVLLCSWCSIIGHPYNGLHHCLTNKKCEDVSRHGPNLPVTYDFFLGGVTRLFWDKVSDVIANKNVTISDECRTGLTDVYRGIRRGSEWAFSFLDSSSKGPVGLLDGSLSSYGDFVQCLAIKSPNNEHQLGSHCMVELKMRPLLRVNSSQHNERVDRRLARMLPLFEYHHITQAICLPSQCSRQDIRTAIGYSLSGSPFEASGSIYCETKVSVDLNTKLAGLTAGQTISLCYLLLVLSLGILGTFSDYWPALLGVSARVRRLVLSFSVRKNAGKLFTVNETTSRISVIDMEKLVFIGSSVAAHCHACTETPAGFLVLNRLHDVPEKLRLLLYQPIMNEGGLGIMIFIGGVVTTTLIYPLMEKTKGRLNILACTFDRWLRFVPCIASLLALEFCWPLIGKGPFYGKVSEDILKKCSSNWWMNVLFISNWAPAEDICIPHTFYSSIDLQLFVVGLLAIYLLYRKASLGIVFCLFMAAVGSLYTAAAAFMYQTQPTAFASQLNLKKTLEYFTYIHLPSTCHFTNYFVGILIGYMIVSGFTLNISRRAEIFCWLYTFGVTSTASFSPALFNCFDFMPKWSIPFYIVWHKFSWIAFFIWLVFYTSCQPAKKRKESEDENNNECSQLDRGSKVKEVFENIAKQKAIKIVCRLSFSVYLINYYYIRYDFFTSAKTLGHDFNAYWTRNCYTQLFVLAAAFTFHLAFEAPYRNIHNIMFGASKSLKKG